MHHRTKKRLDYAVTTRCLGRMMLRLLGWRLLGERPEVPKCVIVAAPHTTNWDLFYSLLAAWGFRIPIVFTMKDMWFFWPLGILFRWLGGIPINRRQRTSMVEQIVQAFDESERLYLVIPPEGTRSKVQQWKTGFYWIANGARVPILLAYIDYTRRVVGLGPLVMPSGDLDADCAKISAFYQETVGIASEFRTKGLAAMPTP